MEDKTVWWFALGGLLLYLMNRSTDPNAVDMSSTDTIGASMANGTSVVDQLFQAIQRQENVAAFHNNPAALTAPAADQVGAAYTPNTTGGVVVNFPTLEDGIAAGKQFIGEFVSRHSGLTIIQAISTYIDGPNASTTIYGSQTGLYPTSVTNYAQGVAQALGASINDIIGTVTG